MRALGKWIKGFLRRRGYILQKYPKIQFDSVSTFDMAVTTLMCKVTEEVKFIQVGANDGVYGDPLRKFIINHPWKGILLEPQPEIFRKLQANYGSVQDRLEFRNCAIGLDGTGVTMYRKREDNDSDNTYASSVASVNANVVAGQLHAKRATLEAVNVPSVTLDTLIEETGFADFHLLQIDTEGFDYQVLSTIDLRKFKPYLIQFEHGHLTPDAITAAVSYLKDNDYKILYGGHQSDTLAIHDTFHILY